MARPFTTGQLLKGADLEQAFVDADNLIGVTNALGKQFSQDVDTTGLLNLGVYGGYYQGALVDDAVVAQAPSATNYVELDTTGEAPAIVANATGWTGTGFVPLFVVVTDDSVIVSVTDARGWPAPPGASLTLAAGEAISIAGSGTKTIGVADGGITDAKVGARTGNPTLASPASTGTLTQLFGWIMGRIKAISGTTNWYDAPATTLAAAATHIAAAAPHTGHLKADGSVTPTADQPMGGFKLTNLADGVGSGDAVNKGQLDSVAGGHVDLVSVKAMATTNVASLSGPATIDTVSLIAADRVLLTGQTTSSENGLWVVQSGAWTRPSDFASASTPSGGTTVFVEFGSSGKLTNWTLTGAASVTVDSSAQVWTKTNANGGGEANTASNQGSGAGQLAMAKSGVDLPFKTLAAGSTKLTVTNNSDTVALDVAPANIDKNAVGGSALSVANGGTGKTSITLGAMLAGNGGSAPTEIAPGANDGVQRFLGLTVSGGVPAFVWSTGAVTPIAGTSTTSLAIGTGSKSLTTQAGIGWIVGTRLLIANTADGTKWMSGLVTAYSGTALTVNVDTVSGSGTVASWGIGITVSLGVTGVSAGQWPNSIGRAALELLIQADGRIATANYNLILGPQHNVSQAAHGFAIGDWIRCSGSDTYAKAKADTLSHAQTAGVVCGISAGDPMNVFGFTPCGFLTQGLSGLTPGAFYYLDSATAGAITATEPTTPGAIHKRVLLALTATSAVVLNEAAYVVGSGGGGLGSVTLTGTPSAGQVPTATSGTAATWQTPGGGSGSSDERDGWIF